MVTYMPILKGREGEFRALARLSAASVRHVLPILEVVPTANGPTKNAYRFGKQVCESVPADLTIAVDVRHLADPTEGVRRPMRDIADDLAAWGIPMLPVLHLYDTAARLADVRHAADLHSGHAVLRLGSDTRDPDDEEAEEALDRLRNQIGLTIEHCHLVLDVFEVRSERDLTRVEPVVRKCVSWAQRYPWRSITVAAGAMPQSISLLPVHTPTPLRRWDLQLWQRVQDLGVQYADYGITHPGTAGAAWRPMPSLRYTDDELWWIYRWPQDTIDRHAMYDLCKALVASDHWPPQGRDFSWGDRQIAARADGVGGPGNAANWRAWTTSHHLAQVIRGWFGSLCPMWV
ncbi:beta family protein [Plantactinospora sp. WMMB782]|uniref:beta family protein n=1 Tax=Plantactinospora sp. WMMB782 TaxID=3404121 RepID=UPI003B9256FA